MLGETLHDSFLETAGHFPDQLAISHAETRLTYAEVAERVLRTAAVLRDAGVKAGDRVVYTLPNSPAFIVTHFAVLACGAIGVPCEYRIPNAPLEYLLNETGAVAVVVSEDVASRFEPSRAVRRFLVGSTISQNGYDDLDAAARQATAARGLPERRSSDPAVVLFTTGTMGKPKGVLLAHENTLFTIKGLLRFLQYTEKDRELITLPLSHSFGLGHAYCSLLSGGAIHVEQGLTNLKRVFDAMQSFQPTGFPGTPAGFAVLTNRAAPLLASAGRSLRFVMVNSAALPPEQAATLQAILPDANICVYYGLTEASRSTVLSLTRAGRAKFLSVGRPLPGAEFRIAPGSSEVLVRGPHVARGYWNDPGATAGAFEDGWLKTGDVGTVDADGDLYITGRLHDQINIGGYKVDPQEVDDLLRASGLVTDAAVFGAGSASGDAVVVAAVVLPSGHDLDQQALVSYCVERLPNYKVPVRWFQVERIPRTDTGKLRRQDLADSYRKMASADA